MVCTIIGRVQVIMDSSVHANTNPGLDPSSHGLGRRVKFTACCKTVSFDNESVCSYQAYHGQSRQMEQAVEPGSLRQSAIMNYM